MIVVEIDLYYLYYLTVEIDLYYQDGLSGHRHIGPWRNCQVAEGQD
jgi:hypothetical protein